MNDINTIPSASYQHVLIVRIPKSNEKNYLNQNRFNCQLQLELVVHVRAEPAQTGMIRLETFFIRF